MIGVGPPSGRRSGEVSSQFRRSGHVDVVWGTCVGERVLPVGEKVEVMLAAVEELRNKDRTADRSTEVVEGGWIDDRARRGEVAQRIEALGAVRFKGAPVKLLRAGFGGGQNRAAATLSVLGRKWRGQHLKLFGRVRRGHEAIGAVDAHVAGQTIDDERIGDGRPPPRERLLTLE